MSQTPSSAFEKSASAGYLANLMARLFAHRLSEAIRPLGLAPAQFMTLLELWAEDGLTQADLVARLAVEQATMAGTIARMERDGLLLRRPHPSDRRAQTLHLTAHAQALRGPASAAAAGVNRRALAALSAAERADFLHLTGKIIAALEK